VKRTIMMVSVALAIAGSGACGEDPAPPPVDETCDSGDVAFVKSASLALLGRRPSSQEEIARWTALLAGPPASGAPEPREALIRTLAEEPAFVDRFTEVIMDHLRVQRSDLQTEISCYGQSDRAPDGGALAAYVRDHAADAGGDGAGPFTARDLLRSAIQLDDLSPALRGNLFAMMRVPIRTCNLAAGAVAELSRRADFGSWFDTTYLNRDMGCLHCHNSEFSVTYSSDEAKNRHWPVPGLFEEALYGSSDMGDVVAAHAMFRFDGLLACPPLDPCSYTPAGEPHQPWGWDAAQCGDFFPDELPPDPANVEARFGSIRGAATVYDLDAKLKRGIDLLAAEGLVVGADGKLADPDAAFAYLVGASLVESVWREVIGTPLTIANHFPRNAASRDLLKELTDRLVKSHFSLRELLVGIASTPWFNPAPPVAGCGEAPYGLANVFNPWTTSEQDEALRGNSAADGVQPLTARTLLLATYAALGQAPELEMFYPGGPFSPDILTEAQRAELAFLKGVGVFLNNGETGFRGLDFQARLLWEERFGGCPNPTGEADYIDGLVERATAAGGTATVRDLVLAMKDRFWSEPGVDGEEPGEVAGLEALFGTSLDSPAAGVADLERRARRLCGVLLASPQFLLGGLPTGEAMETPVLNRVE
jgi:hypothetical protein